MDVNINEIQSRVDAVDSTSLLDQRTLNRIVRYCLEKLREERRDEEQRNADRQLRPSATDEQGL